MSTINMPELAADTQAVMDHLAGKPVEPEVLQRIRERGDEIRKEIFKKHGLVDIGVPAIRELRDS